MGEVRQFPGVITNKMFSDAIDDARKPIAETISKLCKIPTKRVRPAVLVAPILKLPPYGTLHPLNVENSTIVGASPDFARYLNKEQDLNIADALSLSAGVVRSYAIIMNGIYRRKQLVDRITTTGYRSELWHDDYGQYADLETSSTLRTRVMSYRAAATIACAQTGISLPEPSQIPPEGFPPHLAGLFNPLNVKEVRPLGPILLEPGGVE